MINQKIWDFIKFDGVFDKRYKGKENYPFNNRFPSFKTALSLFLQRDCLNILETGCMRQKEDWSAGCSSLIFAETLNDFPEKGKLYSVDISENNLKTCYDCIKYVYDKDRIRLLLGNSIQFLSQQVDFSIGLLYLDSRDILPQNEDPECRESQQHQLNEIRAVYDKLDKNSIVLLDDSAFIFEGKTGLSKQFLREKGWTCVFEDSQSLWILD